MKKDFLDYIYSTNQSGSNKASSYVKALEYLEPILQGVKYFHRFKNIYHITDIAEVEELYNFIKEQQKLGNKGVFSNNFKKSYWHSRFYSAAINCYKQFLIIYQHEQKLDRILNLHDNMDPSEVSKLLLEQKINNINKLDIEYGNHTGKDRTQIVSARVNQHYFRKIILRNYNQQCCINGLNIPDVLRASHIVAWAEDKDNRLNPTNGLCLSATYDAAFDRHLISFDRDCRLILGKALKEFTTNQAFKQHFLAFEGKRISLPDKHLPSDNFLSKHRNKLL